MEAVARGGNRTGGAGDRVASPVLRMLRVVFWEETPGTPGGVDPRSRYVEHFWLPLLGPSATWLLRRLREGLDHAPDGYLLDLDETARSLGLGGSGGRHSPFRRAIARCVRYEMAKQRDIETLAVARHVPLVHGRYLERLPVSLQARHASLDRGSPNVISAPGRLAALDLIAGGLAHDTVRDRLASLGISPELVSDSIAWAQIRHDQLALKLLTATGDGGPGNEIGQST